jgi:hypothetical protein
VSTVVRQLHIEGKAIRCSVDIQIFERFFLDDLVIQFHPHSESHRKYLLFSPFFYMEIQKRAVKARDFDPMNSQPSILT